MAGGTAALLNAFHGIGIFSALQERSSLCLNRGILRGLPNILSRQKNFGLPQTGMQIFLVPLSIEQRRPSVCLIGAEAHTDLVFRIFFNGKFRKIFFVKIINPYRLYVVFEIPAENGT